MDVDSQLRDFGMIGLGTMGRNLLLNLADKGFSVAGYDRDSDKVEALRREAPAGRAFGAAHLDEFVAALSKPRAVMLLIPAGPPVDGAIGELLPRLEAGDLILDGGNSFFKDTDRRGHTLEQKQIGFLGVGISGGESGARHGPSIMPGGPREAWERVRPLLEAVAARVDDQPCAAWLGPGSAGHYVKMVHNGIEYGLMQLIAESYDLMKKGLGFDNDRLHQVYDRWNKLELGSYLLEITANIFLKNDPRGGGRLVDVIRDQAHQKGTGAWASQDAMDLGVPVPVIDTAVALRNLSALKQERERAAGMLKGPNPEYGGVEDTFLDQLRGAFYAAVIMTYAQGFAQLRAASKTYGYGLSLETVARIWRGGCIIRAKVLNQILTAFRHDADLPNLLLDPDLGSEVMRRQNDLRTVICASARMGIPTPSLMASLGYYDGYREAHSPANLIQAQRDYFGAHTYQRVGEEGIFHTQWENQ